MKCKEPLVVEYPEGNWMESPCVFEDPCPFHTFYGAVTCKNTADILAAEAFKNCKVMYGGFPAIDTCTKCGNWRARGMACGFCDRTGQAPCPATAPHEKCNLCRGEGWVEEL